jgi:beta-lactamase regulating signal transducer with metallopeptidase domain
MWWHWPSTETIETRSVVTSRVGNDAAQPVAERDRDIVGANDGFSLPIQMVWQGLRSVGSLQEDRQRAWPPIIAAVFVVGSSVGLAYLLLGLLSVRALRRRSRPIHDAGLLALLESLRNQLSARSSADLRESPDIGSAATIGWRKPLVLLPQDWRSWSANELRAVVAHELAHIHRRDYAIWLFARLSVALHFYNPLVHWLANQLQLQQELAADVVSAHSVGGIKAYLQAVARLALRQDRWLRCWPARAFLAAGGTWKRRIAMLQTANTVRDTGCPRWVQAIVVASLAIVGLGVAVLRVPAQTTPNPTNHSVAGQPRPAADKSSTSPAPFNLAYIPTGSHGFYGIRPAALFRRPDSERLKDAINFNLKEGFEKMELHGGLGAPVEEIEQLTGLIKIVSQPNGEHKHALLASLTYVRIAHDYDWKRQLYTWSPQMAEVSYRGQIYYKAPKGLLAFLDMGPEVCFLIPDGRSIVCGAEGMIRKIIEDGPRPASDFAWAKDWSKVEKGWLAIAIDNRDGHWAKDINTEGETPRPITPALEQVKSIVAGQSGDEGLSFDIYGACSDGETAEKALKSITTFFQVARDALAVESAAKKPSSPDDANKAQLEHELASQFLQPLIERKDDVVHLRVSTKLSVSDYLDTIDGFPKK